MIRFFFSSHERRRPRSSSRSPVQQKNRRFRRDSNEDAGNHEWGKKSSNSNDNSKDKGPPVEKEKPNFGLSGKLTEDTNKVNFLKPNRTLVTRNSNIISTCRLTASLSITVSQLKPANRNDVGVCIRSKVNSRCKRSTSIVKVVF